MLSKFWLNFNIWLKSIQVYGLRSNHILGWLTSSTFACLWIIRCKQTAIFRLAVLGSIPGIIFFFSIWYLTMVTMKFVSSKVHESIQGSVRLINPSLGAKLLVTFPTSPVSQSMSTDGNFWLLETDYVNYSIVFLCLPVGSNISFRKLLVHVVAINTRCFS